MEVELGGGVSGEDKFEKDRFRDDVQEKKGGDTKRV
jgi:hypothetical protein